MESIIKANDGRCYICERYRPLEKHHIMGASNRGYADRDGLFVFLCAECHREGEFAAHRDFDTAQYLKKIAQKAYEETHTHEQWMRRYGRNYLEEK